MSSQELRKKFLEFFKKKNHKIIPSSSLLPTDPSVLLTTAGMQQFKEYFVSKKDALKDFGSKNTASCQKCFRTSDIEEVGDDSHLTFLEMLGNFSFAGYFKEEAVKLAYQFLFEELKLSLDKAIFTVFKGDKNVPVDQESIAIWKKLGVAGGKIKKYGREDNFWGPTGKEGPCGPNTEIHLNDIEIWNLVFNQYYQDEQGRLTLLKQPGVDTGMGLERLAMISQEKPSVFETDLFSPIIRKIEENSAKKYQDNQKAFRIISDHIKGAVFLINDGVLPSNVEQGYILRRILRRAIRYGKIIEAKPEFLIPLANKVIEVYKEVYPEIFSKQADILTVIQNEEEKFEKTLEKGIKKASSVLETGDISGKQAFDIYQTFGFPIEMIKEMAEEKKRKVDIDSFQEELKKHQEISRAGREKKFGGGGQFSSALHSATHLLHAALRQVLGEEVKQMGSDINSERLRFDFSFKRKMTAEEIKKVEDLVNQKIKDDLVIQKKEMSLEQALKSGALAFFKEKYPEKVFVYSINNFSKEICAGPHLERTGQLGRFKIIKEESSGAGIRRIKANLEKKL